MSFMIKKKEEEEEEEEEEKWKNENHRGGETTATTPENVHMGSKSARTGSSCGFLLLLLLLFFSFFPLLKKPPGKWNQDANLSLRGHFVCLTRDGKWSTALINRPTCLICRNIKFVSSSWLLAVFFPPLTSLISFGVRLVFKLHVSRLFSPILLLLLLFLFSLKCHRGRRGAHNPDCSVNSRKRSSGSV